MTGRTVAPRATEERARRPRGSTQLDLWGPRRFKAVIAEREAELLEEGRHLDRAEAERILARLGR